MHTFILFAQALTLAGVLLVFMLGLAAVIGFIVDRAPGEEE